MSYAVAVMLVGGFAIPWTVAGLIHPEAVWMKGVTRPKVVLYGAVWLVLSFLLAALLPNSLPETVQKSSDVEGTLAAIWMLTCIFLPFFALVARTKSQAAKVIRPADPPAIPAQTGIELSLDECVFEPEIAQPVKLPTAVRPEVLSKAQRKALGLPAVNRPKPSPKPPAEPTRAIRTGWRLCEVDFLYEDAKGDTSFRSVTVHWVGDSNFKGECHARQAERTFRLDRIIGDLTDRETGEILSPKKWARLYN